jgi:hypothetical protein
MSHERAIDTTPREDVLPNSLGEPAPVEEMHRRFLHLVAKKLANQQFGHPLC